MFYINVNMTKLFMNPMYFSDKATHSEVIIYAVSYSLAKTKDSRKAGENGENNDENKVLEIITIVR